jgi:hypothetical protein
MGATASIHVVNKAIYDIHVDLYKARDPEGTESLKHYSLLPGEVVEVKVGKGGANIRVSGNGRTEGVRTVTAGQIIEIDKVRRAKMNGRVEALIPAQPTAVVAESRSEPSSSDDETNRQDWVDFKNRSGKDELQQLTRKLEREQLQKRQAHLLERRKQQEEPGTHGEWQRLDSWRASSHP